MAELKRIFESIRLDDVATFIASGNVIFRCSTKDPAKVEDKIEAAIQSALGYPATTMLRTVDEVAAVAKYQAFPAHDVGRSSLYVGFLKVAPAAGAIKKALAMRTEIDDLHVRGREVYWLARKNIQEATITGAALEKALVTPVTFRNINTVRRLAANYPAAPV